MSDFWRFHVGQLVARKTDEDAAVRAFYEVSSLHRTDRTLRVVGADADSSFDDWTPLLNQKDE